MRYKVYSSYLKEKYGEKVYKIPVSLPVTCPNRDGNIGNNGCIFCSDQGAGFEMLSETLSIKEQLDKNMDYMGNKFGAKKFIAYFQNYTNTYIEKEKLVQALSEASIDQMVGFAISTRPDCVSDAYLEAIDQVAKENKMDVTIELGLQTVNYHTLEKINRGHGLAEFIDAVLRIKRYGFDVCAHVILNLPWDEMTDTIETAKILTALNVEQVKLHSLYIEKTTELCKQYLNNEFEIISLEGYVDRVVTFLRYISEETVIQRIAARAPKEDTVFCNWDTSWWVIKDRIEEKLEDNQWQQGDLCHYLNGSALDGKQ